MGLLKKISLFLMAILFVWMLIVSCKRYDDSELLDKIENLESRITYIEDLVNGANENIVALQSLTEGLINAVTILSINEITDGYEILLSNGKNVIIWNGKAGHSPEISVKKDTDGFYYWVIDGAWLLNEEGGKLPVTGEAGIPGKDGITPQLKIEDGYWFVSIDDGKNWSKLGKATGEDGDSFFMSVSYDDYNLNVILSDGTKLSFRRSGKDIPVVKASDLSSDLVLKSFPYSNKFGDQYIFGCKVENFSGIKICKGYESYRANWFEIDETNIVLKFYESSIVEREKVAHGLKITRMLNVNINVTSEGKAIMTMQTLGGSFTHTFDKWGYDANGPLMVKNNGSKLTECTLSAVNNYFKHHIWIFGASYEGVYDARWPGQIKKMGYLHFLLNGYAGRNGAQTIADIRRALDYGCPQFLYYSGSNESSDDVFNKNLNTIKSLCKDKGITLLVYYRPDIPSEEYSARRAAIIEAGCRYVNGEQALHDPTKVWSKGVNTWYDGFLSSDGRHTTELGAKALAMQFLCDFPEIMEGRTDM